MHKCKVLFDGSGASHRQKRRLTVCILPEECISARPLAIECVCIGERISPIPHCCSGLACSSIAEDYYHKQQRFMSSGFWLKKALPMLLRLLMGKPDSKPAEVLLAMEVCTTSLLQLGTGQSCGAQGRRTLSSPASHVAFLSPPTSRRLCLRLDLAENWLSQRRCFNALSTIAARLSLWWRETAVCGLAVVHHACYERCLVSARPQINLLSLGAVRMCLLPVMFDAEAHLGGDLGLPFGSDEGHCPGMPGR